ncbi:uncharacterized protein LOC115230993 [Argonauta hians]
MQYESYNPVGTIRKTEDTYKRNYSKEVSKNHYYPEMEKTVTDWPFSTATRKLPPIPQTIDQPTNESTDEIGENTSAKSITYVCNTLPSQCQSENVSDEEVSRNFSETSISSDIENSKPDVPPKPKIPPKPVIPPKPDRIKNHDSTYLEPRYILQNNN